MTATKVEKAFLMFHGFFQNHLDVYHISKPHYLPKNAQKFAWGSHPHSETGHHVTAWGIHSKGLSWKSTPSVTCPQWSFPASGSTELPWVTGLFVLSTLALASFTKPLPLASAGLQTEDPLPLQRLRTVTDGNATSSRGPCPFLLQWRFFCHHHQPQCIESHGYTCARTPCTQSPSAFPGGDLDCSPADDWESEKPKAQSVGASSSGHGASETPEKNSHNASLWSPWVASEHCQGNILDHSSEFSFLNLCHTQMVLPPRELRSDECTLRNRRPPV